MRAGLCSMLREAGSLGAAAEMLEAGAQDVAALLPLGYADEFLKKAQLCVGMGKGMLDARVDPRRLIEPGSREEGGPPP